MAEFKIKVSVELDDKNLKDQLGKIGEDIELKLNTDKIEGQLKNLKKSFKDAFKLDSSIMNDLNKIAKALEKVNNANSSEGGTSSSKTATSKLINNYKELYNLTTKLQKQLAKGGLGEDSIERTSKQIDKLKNNMSALYNQMSDAQKQNIDLFKAKQTNKAMVDMNSYLNKIESQATSLQGKLKSISFDHIDTGKIDLISAKLEEIQKKAREGIDLDFEDIGNILNDLSKLSTVISDLSKVENLASSFERISSSIAEAGGDVERFQSSIKDLENSATRLDGSFDKAFSNANNELKEMKNNVKRVSDDTRNLGSGLLGTWDDFKGNFAQFTLAEVTGDFIADGIRTMARGLKDTIVETDSAIVDLNKVYEKGLRGDSLKQYLNEFSEVAKQTGKSSVDVIQGTTKAVQSGIQDLDQALVFARQSAIFSNVGDVEQGEADTMLTSIMSAYGGIENSLKPVREQIQGMSKDYSTLTKFMDLANHAGNNYAVTTADVGEALRQSASTLQAQGVSMEQSVGMAVALNEIMQDAGRTGTALKSMSTGMAGLTVSAKDGSIQLTKAGVAMKEVAGIDVWNEQTGELKNMYEVMDELSVKWGDLSEAEQTALGASIAGKTRITEFNALLSNWDTARKYVEDYNKGLTIGSAEKENLQYLDSINGKWNVIKENLKSIGNNLISSDFVKGALDGIGAITDAIAKLSATDFGGKLLGFTALTTGITGIVKAFSALKNVFGAGRTLGTILDVADTADDIADIAVAGGGLTNTFKGLGTKIKNTVTSLGLFSSVGATAWTLLSAGAIGYLGYVVASDKAQTEASKRRITESRELITNLEQEVRASQGVVDSVKNIAEEYDSLATKSNKTTQEQQRFAELTNQVAQTFPDLVGGYDSAGNPILELNGSLETYIANLERAIDKQRRLLDNEEDTLADELEKQMNKGQYLNDLFRTGQAYKQFTNPKNYGNLKSGSKEDLEQYIKDLKRTAKAEDDWYKERMEAVQNYEEAKNDVREKYRNKMEDSSYYKNTSDENKQEMQSIIDMLDLYGMGEEKANKLVKSLVKLDDELVTSTEQMGEHAKGINNLEKAYANGSKNLSQYTDGMIDFYEKAEKIDVESFGNLVNSIKSYADTTGDLEGANAQIAKLSEHMEGLTGLDSGIWEQALEINVEPLEVAQQKLDNFLRTYGTGSQHLGKGGLADKLEKEFQVMRDLPMEFAQEALENGGTISAEFALEATVDAGTSIQEAVKGLLANDNLIDEQELTVLMRVISEIENEGEISAETEQLLRNVLPDEIEDEVISKIRVEADIQGEQEVDAFLQKIKLNETVEQEIRAHVNGKEEVEGLYNAIENLPTDKQLNAVSNFGKVKDEAHQLGVSLEGIPTETLVNIVANMDDAQIENFVQALSQVDGKTVSAFLQTEGAMEALQQCETVQQMLDLINGKKTIAEIEAENNAEEEVEKTKQSLDEIDGKNVTANLLVETDEGNLEQTKSALVEIDGKTYLTVVNVDTNETELVPFEGKLNEIDGKTVTATAQANTTGEEKVQSLDNTLQTLPKSTTSTVNANVSGEGDVKSVGETIERLPSTKEIVVSVVQSGTNLIDSIANWINSKAEQNVEIKAKVGKVDTSALDSIKAKDIDIKAKVGKVDTGALDGIKAKDIDIKAKVGKVDTSALNGINAPTIDVSAKVTGLDQVNSLKSSLSSIQNKVVSITASGNALAQVNQIKTALSGIQSKSISISAGGNALGQINSIKSALAGLQSKTVSVTAITNGIGNVNALKASIAGLQGKSVSVSASTSGTGEVNALTSAIGRVQGKSVSVVANVSGTSAVNALTSAINKVKSKSVKVSASVSGTGAVQSLASAISSVRSKSVTVSVNRRVTESVARRAVGSSISAYSVNTANVSLASAPVTTNSASSVTPSYGTATASASNPLSSATVNLSNLMEEFKFDIDSFKNLEEALNRISGRLGIVEEKMENAFGKERVSLLHQQINLLKQQQDVQERIYEAEVKQNGELYDWLSNKGFQINDIGDITNYQNQLLKMEKNVESLKKKYDDLNSVTGDNKNEEAIKKANKAYEDASEELSEVKEHLEEYARTNNSEMSEAKKKWYEYQNAIIEAEKELKNLQRELKELSVDSGYKDNNRDIAMVENELDMLDAKIDGLDDSTSANEKNKLLEERIGVIQRLQKEMNDLLSYEEGLKNSLIQELSKYGFKIRDDGSIEGYGTKIQELKQTLSENEFEIVFEMVEQYLEKIQDTIPDIRLEWEKLNNEINNTKREIKDNIVEEEKKAREEAERLAEEMENARKEAEKLAQDKFLNNIQNAIQEVNNEFEELGKRIDLVDAKMENTNGGTRVDFLRDKIALLNEQIELTSSNYRDLMNQRNKLKNTLLSYNFRIENDGIITNYDEALSSYIGTDNYDYIKNLADEYMSIYNEMMDIKIDAIEAQNEIENIILEMRKIGRENSLMKLESTLSVINSEFEQMSLLIDEINGELEYSYGTDKINKMKNAIELMNKQLALQTGIIDNAKAKMRVYKNELIDYYGAEFDGEGNIINLDDIIKIQSSSNTFEDFQDVLEGYFDAQSNIKDVIGDYNDLEIAIKDAYREQLEITQEIEEELTEILEKELEKRKNAVEEYTESRIKLLEEEKKAYKEMRDEQNYNESVDDQLKEIEVLRKQIETARKDTSISGQKRLAELTKELAEAEKELAEITQDKIDQDYESNIDKEIEKLEKEQDDILKSLEEKFSEENIAKIVAESLASGFIEINGEIQSIQDVLMDSINNSADGYSVMADIIKNELVANLNVALNTMKEIESINDALGLQNYNLISSTSLGTLKEPTYESGNNVTIGDTYLNISGNVSENIISDIEDLIDQKNNEMLNKIASNL